MSAHHLTLNKKIDTIPAAVAFLLGRRKLTERDRYWHRIFNKWQREERKMLRITQQYFNRERRAVKELLNKSGIQAGRYLQAATPEEFETVLAETEINLSAWLIQRAETVLSAVAKVFSVDTSISLDLKFPGLPSATIRWLKTYVPKFADQINQTSRNRIMNQIRQGIAQGEGFDKIRKRVDLAYTDFVRSRAPLIASQETGVIASQVQQDTFRQLDIPISEIMQTWLTARDVRVRDSHQELEGEQRRIGQEFIAGVRFPRDPEGPASETINCRCVLLGSRVPL